MSMVPVSDYEAAQRPATASGPAYSRPSATLGRPYTSEVDLSTPFSSRAAGPRPAVAPRRSKVDALRLARRLKRGIAVSALAGFGILSLAVGGHIATGTSHTATSAASSTSSSSSSSSSQSSSGSSFFSSGSSSSSSPSSSTGVS